MVPPESVNGLMDRSWRIQHALRGKGKGSDHGNDKGETHGKKKGGR
jgi:hypothetical protein